MPDLNSSNAFNKDCILQYQITVGTGVSVGDLVYYDTTAACYKKAKAQFQSDSATGQLLPTDRCHVQGLIVAQQSTGNSYVLLRQGYLKNSIITNTLGMGATQGIYYLSASDSGKATKTPDQNVMLPCISYYGNYAFSLMSSHYVKIGKSQNVLKGIKSQTLDISDSGQGILRIEQPERALNSFSSYPFAIASLTPRSLTYVPIVSKLRAGAGTYISDLGNGRWQISAKSVLNTKLTATDFTLNGTQRAADSLLTYTVFPANAVTSMVMSMPVSFLQSSDSFNGTVSVWMTTRGPGTVTYNISIYWIPYSASSQIPNTTSYTASINTDNSSTTELSLVQTAPISINFTGQGILLARIQTASAPGDDCYVHQAGFQFIQQAVVQQEQQTSDAAPAIPMTEQAVRNIIADYLRWQN